MTSNWGCTYMYCTKKAISTVIAVAFWSYVCFVRVQKLRCHHLSSMAWVSGAKGAGSSVLGKWIFMLHTHADRRSGSAPSPARISASWL